MEFCVVVKISRRSVTFWYQTEGRRYSPLALKGSHEVPLYFYVDNNQFNFGLYARERFHNHDPNAFGHYFEIIKDPSRHFILQNSPRRVKQLLYYGIEQYLSHFLNTVLYKSDSIESYRPTFPIKFIFEPDLSEPERNLVEQLFIDAGYRRVSVVSYNDRLLEHLRAIRFIRTDQAALMLTGLDNTLYLDLYPKDSESPVSTLALADQGSDPRIRILAEMILNYINEQNPYLNLDKNLEISALLPYCAVLLAVPRMIATGEAELTSGTKFWFRVNLKTVEERSRYYQDDLVMSTSIGELLQNYSIKPVELVILLCSEQIKTSYFSERLLKQFPMVRNVEPIHADDSIQLIFNTISNISEIPPILPVISQVEKQSPKLPPPLPPKKQDLPAIAAKPPLPVYRAPVTSPAKPPLPEARPAATERPKTAIPPLPPHPKKT